MKLLLSEKQGFIDVFVTSVAILKMFVYILNMRICDKKSFGNTSLNLKTPFFFPTFKRLDCQMDT